MERKRGSTAARKFTAIWQRTALSGLSAAPVLAASLATAEVPAGYHEQLRAAMNAFVAEDVPSAERAFAEALALAPSQPDALCYRAEMRRATGDMNAALEGFEDCLRFARETDDRRFVGRALHGVASTLERMPGRMQDARVAWQEHVRFADASGGLVDGRIGRARIEAIDAWLALGDARSDLDHALLERERAP